MIIAQASLRLVKLSALLGWTLLLGFAVRTAMLGRIGTDVRAFQAAYVVGFVGYALLVWVVTRRGRAASIAPWTVWLV